MKIVLHICCGVCAAGTASVLLEERHQITGYYYNPNIFPREEYEKRLDATVSVADRLGFQLIEGPYDPQAWLESTAALAGEPEGGRRCDICYRIRLNQTARYALDSGADAFTSTLTISPHKSALTISRIGQEIGGELFLPRDFKKKDGFKKAAMLAREWNLYRQNYCGCQYSRRDA